MGRRKKEVQKIFKFELPVDNYIIGELDELFQERTAKNLLTKIKKKNMPLCGYLEDYNLYYFTSLTKSGFDDYIENNWIFSGIDYLILTTKPNKEGRIYNCKRFKPKSSFTLIGDYTEEWAYIYMRIEDEPGPFHMFGEISDN